MMSKTCTAQLMFNHRVSMFDGGHISPLQPCTNHHLWLIRRRARRWAASILPATDGDGCITMTRTSWTEECCMHTTGTDRSHAKQRKYYRAQQQARLARVGEQVEVWVSEQRDWFAGKVVADPKGGKLLAVKFSNGAVLLNVRSTELRSVPRTTLIGWAFVSLYVCLLYTSPSPRD